MGRTVPSMTQVFYQEQESFSRFRRSLRRQDQLALDDLFAAARKHLSASAYASHPLPFETFLLAMLLEEHKETQRLRQELAYLQNKSEIEGLDIRSMSNPSISSFTPPSLPPPGGEKGEGG